MKIPFSIGMNDDSAFAFAGLWEGWKDPATAGEVDDGDLKELLKPFAADQMKMWPISPRVNSPKNDDPDILTPIGA
jgi:putative SOS response-associated peptidase YedK